MNINQVRTICIERWENNCVNISHKGAQWSSMVVNGGFIEEESRVVQSIYMLRV